MSEKKVCELTEEENDQIMIMSLIEVEFELDIKS